MSLSPQSWLERFSRLGTADYLASDLFRSCREANPSLLFTGQRPTVHRVLARAVLAAQVGWVGRVAQVGVTTSAVGAPYAIWSSFPVEVESEALSSAMEASLR